MKLKRSKHIKTNGTQATLNIYTTTLLLIINRYKVFYNILQFILLLSFKPIKFRILFLPKTCSDTFNKYAQIVS